MTDAIFILTFIFFLGFCFYLGLVGRSFWLVLLITACIFAALNTAEIIMPKSLEITSANVVGMSVLISLIYLVPVIVSFGIGFIARSLTKPAFGGGPVNPVEWGLIAVVTFSVFAANLVLRANADDPLRADQNQHSE